MKSGYKNKKLIVFDLDGTLTPSKSKMEREMSQLLAKLLLQKKVAVIGGGQYALFKMQLLERLIVPHELLENLFLFPTNATTFYRYRNGWEKIYAKTLTKQEKQRIRKAFAMAFENIGYHHPLKTYGTLLEDRGTQMAFSALGQDVVKVLGKRGLHLKEEWRKKHDVRPKLVRALKRYLSGFEVRIGGLTTIDVTKKGIDKAYGIRQIEKQLRIPRRQMLFIGDAMFPGGNDYAVVKTGVDWMAVNGPRETKKIIRSLLK